MRFLLMRLTMAAILFAIWWPIDNWLAVREIASEAPVEFRFELPFTDTVLHKYGLPADVEVDEVILTGRHADWLIDNTNFRMQRRSPTSWTLSLRFRPGRHPYKFVVRLSDPARLPKWAKGVIWCHDKNAVANVDDNFGGLNSVLVVEDAATTRTLARIVFVAAVILIVLHWLLAAVVRLLLRRRFSLRWKLVLVYAVLLFLVLAAFFTLTEHQKRTFAIRAAIDKINMLHALFLGEGVRWAGPIGTDREAVLKARRVLGRFFSGSTVRYDFHVFSNSAQQIVRFFLLAPDGRLVDYLLDRSAADYYLARHAGNRQKVDKFHTRHISLIFAAYAASIRPDRLADPWTAYWSDYLTAVHAGDGSAIAEHDRKTAGFRHDTFLMPVYEDMALRGYYLVGMNPESYAAEFARHRGFAFLLTGFVGILFLLIVLDLGRCLLRPLSELHAWTEAVARGDVRPRLDPVARQHLATGDEIGGLTANFDRMQASLAAHLDGLAAVSALSGLLPRLRTRGALYRALLSFLVAPFGFAFQRAAVFLRDPDRDSWACRYAAGSAEVYGPAARRCATLEEFLADPGREAEDDPFSRETVGKVLPAGDWTGGAAEAQLSPQDPGGSAVCNLKAKFPSGAILVQPIRCGEATVGLLLADGHFHDPALGGDETRRLEILLNEFAVALENTEVLANLEDQVAARTAELSSALERLSSLAEAERFAAVGKLLAGVAHEIFNPLSAIRAPLDFLERDLARGGKADEATRAEAFRHAREGLARVERLVKGLRDLFTGRETKRESLDLEEAAAPFVELARARAPAGVIVSAEIPAGIRIEAGRDALAHLLTNLLANAVDAVGETGTVRITAATAPDGIVELAVSDDGSGMETADLPRLFDPFWTTKPPGAGTGLGLFLVKDIAIKYGWKISADSPGPGKGSVFTVRFGEPDGR